MTGAMRLPADDRMESSKARQQVNSEVKWPEPTDTVNSSLLIFPCYVPVPLSATLYDDYDRS